MRHGWRRGGVSGAFRRAVPPLCGLALLGALAAAAARPAPPPVPDGTALRAATRAPAETPAPAPLSFGPWAAGYMTQAPADGSFTAAAAAFVLPARAPDLLPPPADAAAGAWVTVWTGIGLGAANGTELMQAGVSMRAGAGGWDLVAPWWINEPAVPTAPHLLPLAVAAGDTVRAAVALADPRREVWTFTVTDLTTGRSAAARCSGCVSRGDSAGWLVEDPSMDGGYTPFADPGRVVFLSAEAALDGGPLRPMPVGDWHPVIRDAGGDQARQGPLGAEPGPAGAFTVGDLPPPAPAPLPAPTPPPAA